MLEKLFLKQHIRKLDLSSVRAKLMEKAGWSSERTFLVEDNYKRFLYALGQIHAGEMISPPSDDVDEFWHQHILDTRKYREDCENLFGRYIDHTPQLTTEEQRRADERRRKVYDDHKLDRKSFANGDGGGVDGGGCGGSSTVTDHSHSSHHTTGCHDASSSHSHDGGGHGGDSGSCGDGGSGGDGGGGCGGGSSCGGGGCGGG